MNLSPSGRVVIAFSLGAVAAAMVTASTMMLVGYRYDPEGQPRPKRLAQASPAPQTAEAAKITEGKVIEIKIVAGPFDLHRKYRSMEGPWISSTFKVADLVASKEITLPEGMVSFAEEGGAGPSMTGGPESAGTPQGLVASKSTKRELYWFKGMKLEVLDEKDQVLPTAEFICHFNVDVDPDFRNAAFVPGEKCTNPRLISISQGCTRQILPEGCAVPAASDEPWQFSFQAANRTTTQHRRVKHVCTVYLLKDSELWNHVKPLHWKVPYVSVVAEGDYESARRDEKRRCPPCVGSSLGVNAPNNVLGGLEPEGDRVTTGHWVVPPGKHTFCGSVSRREPDFAKRARRIFAAWTHIHPMCTEFSLNHVSDVGRHTIFTARVKTNFHDGGFEIDHLDYLATKDGIHMPAGEYEMEVKYDNTTPEAHDSMASTGVYFEDTLFRRPTWSLLDPNVNSCGVEMGDLNPPTNPAPLPPYPLFDVAKDGPLLTGTRKVELETTYGKIHLLLETDLAPIHVTQLCRLFGMKAYDGVEIHRYEKDFVFQIGLAEFKASGYPALSEEAVKATRRLPVEAKRQVEGKLRHEKGVISMARADGNSDTGTTSFSLILGDAPHLDKEYTIFGHLINDDATVATLDRIAAEWGKQAHPVITATRLLD